MTDPAPRAQTFAINGFEMHVAQRGQGEPLLLLHGGGGAGVNWDLVFDEPPEGWRLIVPDLRGHGRSTNPSGQVTIRGCAEDVLALLDTMGVARCRAVGMSLGAKTLLHVATMQPFRLESMVLVSATPYFPAQARALMAQTTEASRTPEEWAMMRRWHAHGDDQIRALWRMMREFKDSYTDLSFTPPHLATIAARTLIVHGDRDPLYPVELALELYRSIPDASLWVVPGGGHGPIFGALAAPFRETALSFLSGPSGAGTADR